MAAAGPSPADLNAIVAITYTNTLDTEEEGKKLARTSAQVEVPATSPAVSPATKPLTDGSDGGSAVQYKSIFAPSNRLSNAS